MTAFTSDATSKPAGMVPPLTEIELLELLRRRELTYRSDAETSATPPA